ncbi:MAG: hypothetical protein PHY47_18115 [Lachnospiraceae bacterium]|nr:hypothetical protein [Lachnospiraceae bacterium]
MKNLKKAGATLLCMCLCIATCTSCGTKNKIPADADALSTLEDPAPSTTESVSTVLDKYYANDKFMIEMLVNEDVIIKENDGNITFTTAEDHAGIVISMIPGVQNLTAAGELCNSTVLNAFPGAQTGEMEDAYLFGARAKFLEYSVSQEDCSFMGIEATAIINQSCYFMNTVFYEGISKDEGKLIVDMFKTMNVLQPTNVDSGAQKAEYTSIYAEQLKTQQIKPSKQTKVQSAEQLEYLPYYYYSWYGDPGDSFDAWYYEPDWDYYKDSSDYWSWGWDNSENWSFYDEYDDFYAWDTYQEYQDYYGDDYAEYYDWSYESNDYEFSDSGDYYDDGYDTYSDPGDGDDEWSDPGDYYDDGYDTYSDPGDGDDEWSDSGDYYDEGDYEEY